MLAKIFAPHAIRAFRSENIISAVIKYSLSCGFVSVFNMLVYRVETESLEKWLPQGCYCQGRLTIATKFLYANYSENQKMYQLKPNKNFLLHCWIISSNYWQNWVHYKIILWFNQLFSVSLVCQMVGDLAAAKANVLFSIIDFT